MQITHEQAHGLIQLKMDQGLSPQDAGLLSTHLQDCPGCRSYASEIREVERLLPSLLKKQWSHQPAPLSVSSLTEKSTKIHTDKLLTMRRAAIGLIMTAIFFGVWHAGLSGLPASGPLPVLPLPIPSPSAQSTSTTVTAETCEMLLYTVQQEDTLAGIADKFSTSEQEIAAINNLASGTIRAEMELTIPLCHPTPTGTVASTFLTKTDTPAFYLITSTPVGNY